MFETKIQISLEEQPLAAFAATVWRKSRRGIALSGLDAAMATAMELHTEWWSRWDWLVTGVVDHETLRHLQHIQEDASVLLQVSAGNPAEVREFYVALVAKGYAHLRAIHTIGLAVTDESARVQNTREDFDVERYLRGARMYVNGMLQSPAVRQPRTRTWSEILAPSLAEAC